MVRRLLGLLLPLAGSALAVWLSTLIIPGIVVSAETTAGTIGTVVLIALIFGVVNTFIKPIAKLVGCGIYILTLGLIALVVNGALLMLTSAIAEWLGIPFNVRDFWPDGILGALFIGIVSWALNRLSDVITKKREPRRAPPPPQAPPYRPMPSR
jgi:putative membrane protein